MYVRPRYRGTSVSRNLMEAALQWAAAEPWQDRLLSSFPLHNVKAERFLDRWEFQPLSERERIQRIPGVLPGYVVVERVRSGPQLRLPG
ncbi:GNAT family N-acetyltransferase [Pseudoxanthomonas putridarboris]|uniref:GNAT family N-acetyltransferase n=1 Tax=Pseudoxanthomonas putridarboris TaxID=752605 RepID=A0ABU9IVN2_9GAMM